MLRSALYNIIVKLREINTFFIMSDKVSSIESERKKNYARVIVAACMFECRTVLTPDTNRNCEKV